MTEDSDYPALEHYAFISGCKASALVSREGSIDWCCMPEFDSGSCFGRLLDWGKGGYCAITPVDDGYVSSRQYVDDSLVLETTYRSHSGEARLFDCFAISPDGSAQDRLLRVIEGVRGQVDFVVTIQPRFDYGAVKPWLRQEDIRSYSAIGGNDGLFIEGDLDITVKDPHELEATVTVRAGERVRLSIRWLPPESIGSYKVEDADQIDRAFAETGEWWHNWASSGQLSGPKGPGALRSALVLKGLTNVRTGAIVAAATTSLPESPSGSRNWDYRYSWIRDSTFSVHALTELGYAGDANNFRRFVERSAASGVESLQIMYGVGGRRRLNETCLDNLEGYRGARPVRLGNGASEQVQLDAFGEILELAWRWHQRGKSPDDDYWRFLVDVVNAAVEHWNDPDHGIWEMRGEAKHFVQSKVACWTALDRGLRLAEECYRKVPERRWQHAREAIRQAVEQDGYDAKRGVFVQAFGSKEMDAALLLLPMNGFVAYDDERMIRTTYAIIEDLGVDGLLLRYKAQDNLTGSEGAFIACSFWLAECLAYQHRLDEAQTAFDRAVATSNDLGLFSEEYDVHTQQMLGNLPQGLTHLSHIMAAVALTNAV